MSGVFAALNDFPGSAGKDMLFLRTLSSIANTHGTPSLASGVGASWRDAHQDLQQFMDRNSAYDEIFLHTETVGCTMAVKKTPESGGNDSCASHAEIDGALAALKDLPDGSVYISPLYMHAHESGGAYSTVPALQYAVRMSVPQIRGSIVSVINANYFLDEVRRLKREGEVVYLVALDGSYIAHPEQSKEKLMGGAANFYAEYPEVSPEALRDPETRRIESAQHLFTFLRISPTASNFALYDGSDARESEYWVMVAVSDKSDAAPWWASLSYLVAAAVVIAVHALVAGMLRVALFPVRPSARAEHADIHSSTV